MIQSFSLFSCWCTWYLMEEGDQTTHLGSHYIGHDFNSQGLKMVNHLNYLSNCSYCWLNNFSFLCNTLFYFIYLAKHMKCSVKLLLIYKCICNCCFYLFLAGIWVKIHLAPFQCWFCSLICTPVGHWSQ